MTPHIHNTRALGNGDTIQATDFAVIPATGIDDEPEFIPVEEPEVGRIIDGSEFLEFRRLTQVDPIVQICNENDIVTPLGKEALKIAIQNIALFDKKNRDYGSGNIAAFGEYGVMVRISDKFERLKNLLRNVQDPSNESIDDTWLDISNYGLIGQMLRKKLWK